MAAGAAFALAVCAGLVAVSVSTFGAAAVLVRRARRAEQLAREKLAEAERSHEAGRKVHEEAQRIHRDCQRPQAVIVPVMPGGVPQWHGPRGVS